ncbi:hypothetical protein OIN60_05870 [Paenibacillus sp. P96]|uniref:Permuted papain-like amidase YaeF/Yiix C92 family enzyme n=1 Tax=Paenibacillus zeirhizosphaerae TaxID=2987519 RepID=A0ABT9FP60_9BACL|nr:hypothetical protein [Paenibacillus sp. P96]MDP4096296.1 hypothetical protein [Paenibacillus sp. P96]
MYFYQKNDHEDHSLYVLLTHTGTHFTNLIRQFTSAPYNHASLALDAGLNEVFSFGRKQAACPWVAGFVQEDIYEGTYCRYPDTECMLLRIRVARDVVEKVAERIEYFSLHQHRYRYNLMGLLGVVLQKSIEPENAYFCSQFVADIFRQSGLPLWERPSGLVTPYDFLLHPAFELVYEGPLYDYPLLDRKKLVQKRLTTDEWGYPMEPYPFDFEKRPVAYSDRGI